MYLVTLNCFSEAESASIRSASKFCFDLDVRIFFQLFQKIFFRSIQRWGPHFFRRNLKSSSDFFKGPLPTCLINPKKIPIFLGFRNSTKLTQKIVNLPQPICLKWISIPLKKKPCINIVSELQDRGPQS